MDEFFVRFPEAVCLGASLALSGLCFYLYKKSTSTLDKLTNVPHLSINGTLKDIVNVTPGACLPYVVIKGVVTPLGTPLRSHFHPGFVGVLRKFTLTEHRLLWNGRLRSWMDDVRVLHQRVNTVPFSLVGPDRTAVTVLSPLQASGVHTEITYERFHEANYSFFDAVGQYFSGVKRKGQLDIEEMLKVGTILTGVGRIVQDTDGSLSLQPPSDGSQYFLSMADFDTLRGEHATKAFTLKALAATSALAGAAVLLCVGLRYYRHQKRRQQQELDRQESERVRTEATRVHVDIAGPGALQTGANEQRDMCVICLSEPRNCILLDCGHICCCFTCYQALLQNKCPICRRNIVRVLPIYQV
ncbi:mitochondrial ubiquitin ligase activator of nfkb 1-A-like [Pholidichthys leucotaenia]